MRFKRFMLLGSSGSLCEGSSSRLLADLLTPEVMKALNTDIIKAAPLDAIPDVCRTIVHKTTCYGDLMKALDALKNHPDRPVNDFRVLRDAGVVEDRYHRCVSKQLDAVARRIFIDEQILFSVLKLNQAGTPPTIARGPYPDRKKRWMEDPCIAAHWYFVVMNPSEGFSLADMGVQPFRDFDRKIRFSPVPEMVRELIDLEKALYQPVAHRIPPPIIKKRKSESEWDSPDISPKIMAEELTPDEQELFKEAMEQVVVPIVSSSRIAGDDDDDGSWLFERENSELWNAVQGIDPNDLTADNTMESFDSSSLPTNSDPVTPMLSAMGSQSDDIIESLSIGDAENEVQKLHEFVNKYAKISLKDVMHQEALHHQEAAVQCLRPMQENIPPRLHDSLPQMSSRLLTVQRVFLEPVPALISNALAPFFVQDQLEFIFTQFDVVIQALTVRRRLTDVDMNLAANMGLLGRLLITPEEFEILLLMNANTEIGVPLSMSTLNWYYEHMFSIHDVPVDVSDVFMKVFVEVPGGMCEYVTISRSRLNIWINFEKMRYSYRNRATPKTILNKLRLDSLFTVHPMLMLPTGVKSINSPADDDLYKHFVPFTLGPQVITPCLEMLERIRDGDESLVGVPPVQLTQVFGHAVANNNMGQIALTATIEAIMSYFLCPRPVFYALMELNAKEGFGRSEMFGGIHNVLEQFINSQMLRKNTPVGFWYAITAGMYRNTHFDYILLRETRDGLLVPPPDVVTEIARELIFRIRHQT